MDYSINHLIEYVKANWKHLLAGAATYYLGSHYGPAASAKVSVVLKALGVL